MPADERAEIEAAMDRLLAGTPLRSGGQLTIVSLAAEAGVKRHALTHKHTDLKDRFYARVKAQDSVPASETALREQNAELRRKLDDMRAERDEYKQAADALARALNVLTIENDELRRKAHQAGQLRGPRPLTQLHRFTGSLRVAQLSRGTRLLLDVRMNILQQSVSGNMPGPESANLLTWIVMIGTWSPKATPGIGLLCIPASVFSLLISG
jgi:hypothetical protein